MIRNYTTREIDKNIGGDCPKTNKLMNKTNR